MSRRPLARWGLFAVAVLLALALVATVVSGYRGATRVAEHLARGRGQALVRDAISELRSEPIDAERLEEILERHAQEGLTYVAVLEGSHRVRAEAGESHFDLDPRPGQAWTYDRELGRARVVEPMPPGSGPRPPPRDRFRPLGRGGPPERPPHPPQVLVEFEALEAKAFEARSARGLGLASLTALALTVAAFVFVRLSMRADRAIADLDRQRHLATLGEMSAVLAHEIRNPLASLKGQAQLLVESVADESSRARAELVVAEAVRLERLTSVLLDFTRTGSVEPTPSPPGRVLERAVSDAGGQRVRVSISRDLPERWSLDETRMTQVLANLLLNALEASAESGAEVEALVGLESGKLVYTVRDQGPGLPSGDTEPLFEAFHTTKLNGTGLGLAVARRIVELHGGVLEGANHPAGGAVFRVILPAA